MIKILGFAASNSSVSINKKLVDFAVSFFTGHEINILDINEFEMPLYSHDREVKSGIPEKALIFADRVMQADLIIISFAEHNGSYSAAFKNIFDWVSRIKDKKVWSNKNLFLMATAPGLRGGMSVLSTAASRFPRHGAKVLDTFSLPNYYDSFDESMGITAENYLTEFQDKIRKIKEELL